MIPLSEEVILKKDEEEERNEMMKNLKNSIKSKRVIVIDKSKKNEFLYLLFSRKVAKNLINL